MEITIDGALQKGIEAHKTGKIQEADRFYSAILKVQPKHPDANYNLAVLAVGIGKLEQAIPLFKRALEANPSSPQFWLSYIDVLIKSGRISDAQRVMEQAKQRGAKGSTFDRLKEKISEITSHHDIKNMSTLFEEAIELKEAGHYQKAVEWIELWISDKENSDKDIVQLARAYALISHVCLLNQQMDLSLANLKQAEILAPADPYVHRACARLALRQNQADSALAAAKAAEQADPNNPESWLVLAQALSANQCDTDAMPLLEKTLQACPDNAEAFANRAMIRLREGNQTAALADFEQALRAKPHMSQLWSLTATLRYQKKDLPGAIAAYKKIFELEPKNVEAMAHMGTLLVKNEQADKVFEELRQAVDLDPTSFSGWATLGGALEEAQRTSEAITAYEKGLSIKPDWAEMANYIGTLFLKEGQLELAQRKLTQAIQLKPDFVEAYNTRACALKKMGRLEKGLEDLDKAIQLKPDYADGYYNKGIFLNEQGNFEAAIESYTQALKVKPDYVGAYIGLAHLQARGGNYSEALNLLNKAHRLSPKNEDIVVYFSNYIACVQPDYPLAESLLGRIHLKLASLWQHYKTDPLPDDAAVREFVNHLFRILKTNQMLHESFQLSQIFRGTPGICNQSKFMALFEHKNVVPEYCFGCYKVVLSFDNFFDFIRYNFYMDGFDPEAPLRRKLMIDTRGVANGSLKGFYYTRDWDEAHKVCDYLKQLMAKNMKYEFSAKVKRGCSEFQEEYPEYNTLDSKGEFVMTCSDEWKAIEAEFYACRSFYKSIPQIPYDDLGLTLTDALIMRNWVMGRKNHGHDDFQLNGIKRNAGSL